VFLARAVEVGHNGAMKNLSYASSIAIAALLAGCGGSQIPQSYVGTPMGVATQLPSQMANVNEDSSRSWIAPAAKADALVYVSPSEGPPKVEVYSWKDHTLVGTLTGFVSPKHLCADKAGNVFIPDGDSSQIFEYAHGGTSPIQTLTDVDHTPIACSSDDVTGNLAVVDYDVKGFGIAIYHNASGKPMHEYPDNFRVIAFTGYDAAGNLFVDGKNHSDHFVFAELPNGEKSFTHIEIEPANFTPLEPGSIQWDGKYIVVGDEAYGSANRFTVTGSTGTYEGRTYLLGGDGPIRQFWIPKFPANVQAKHIVAAQYHVRDIEYGDVGFWSYPKGGTAKDLIVSDHPLGVTVSIAK
jgi:hypothetical protein